MGDAEVVTGNAHNENETTLWLFILGDTAVKGEHPSSKPYRAAYERLRDSLTILR